ncbi:MAG: hypothetical protein PHQ96_00210 [Candidatus Omnitrophica bacterium]|nr:hypothetical protein [Candidatus Omnitrophota bacterium]
MKIALVEREDSFNADGFDKIIPFCRHNYTNQDNLIELSEIFKISDDIHSGLQGWMDQNKTEVNFVYLGADILQAYGANIFEYLFNFYPKVYALKKVLKKESPAQLWISSPEAEPSLENPYLNQFIADFLPDSVALKYFEYHKKPASGARKPKNHTLRSIRFMLDLIRKLSNAISQNKKNDILICSDMSRVKTLLKHLKRSGVIFIREDFPERLIFPLCLESINLKLFSDFKISGFQEKEISAKRIAFIEKLSQTTSKCIVGGLDLTPYVKKYLTTLWQRELLRTLERVCQMHSLFKIFQIKSLLVDEDITVQKNLLVQVSKNYHCKSYVSCHGDPFYKIGTVPLTADYILAWGAYQKNLFIKWGLSENKILITGSLKYDQYKNMPAQEAKRRICKDLKLIYSKQVLLIIPYPLNYKSIVWENYFWLENKRIASVASAFKDLQIVIKVHPCDINVSEWCALAESLGIKQTNVLKNYDPLLLAKGVDLLAVSLSTFAIDGMAYKKPVILTDGYSMEKYQTLNIFYDGTTGEKLKNSISGILNGSYKNHIVNWQAAADYMLNGMGDRISQTIMEILEQR